MNVVVDTNVFVSSFFGGNPRKIIDRWFSGEITLCLSSPILDEYFGVLDRMGLKGTAEAQEILSHFRKNNHCRFKARPAAIKFLADPDDDKFLAAAVELKAEYIISGDKHLLVHENYMGIAIVTPKRFLEF